MGLLEVLDTKQNDHESISLDHLLPTGRLPTSPTKGASGDSPSSIAAAGESPTNVAPTNCAVCNRETTCYHYGAPSCTACRSFLRRSVVLGRVYVCSADGNCDLKSGAKCRRCRYVACLKAGMDVRAIRLPVGVDPSGVVGEMGRQKRPLSEDEEAEAKVCTKIVPRFNQTMDSRVVDFLAYLELKFNRLRESEWSGCHFYESPIREVLQTRSELANADKHEKVTDWGALRRREGWRNWLLVDLILNIEYLKAMPFFYELCLNDQEALSMHVVLVVNTLMESFDSFRRHSSTLLCPDGTVPLAFRRGNVLSRNHKDPQPLELDCFCRNVDVIERVAPEEEEYFLLKALLFCHSETPGLSPDGQRVLEEHRSVYSRTLLRRLQGRRGNAAGARRFAELTTLIESFFHFGQKKREFHVYMKALGIHIGADPKLQDWFILNSSRFD